MLGGTVTKRKIEQGARRQLLTLVTQNLLTSYVCFSFLS